jgi:hypothetical protein
MKALDFGHGKEALDHRLWLTKLQLIEASNI